MAETSATTGPGDSSTAQTSLAENAHLVAAAADPAVLGSWEKLPFGSEVLAMHAALLPTGELLFAAGSGNSDVRFNGPGFGDTTLRNWTSVVWDPTINPPAGQDPQFFHPATVHDPQGHVLDLFCGGETLLPDGRVLAAGGTLAYDGTGKSFAGRPVTMALSPVTEQWTVLRPMAHGRWYPTLIVLGDGRVLVAAGLDETGHGRNHILESYFAAPNRWQLLAMPPDLPQLPLYARLYLLADGSMCYAGGHMDDGPADPLRLDLTRSPATVTSISGLTQVETRDQCSSALLPPAQAQKIMIIEVRPAAARPSPTWTSSTSRPSP